MASPTELDAMRQAIALSALGLGTTSPNPPVGCVMLDRSWRLVGTGYHQRKGESHAETQALTMAGERARGGTAVVTLEPCNHAGRTPACRQALLDAQIARVVIAVLDPTSRDGGGAAALTAAGVDVEVDVLSAEAARVLESWLTSTRRRRPYVTWAYVAAEATAAQTLPDLVDDLRRGVDLVVHADGRVEEGIPGGHGDGMLKIPSTSWEATDPLVNLVASFSGGARSILVAGVTPLARSLHDGGAVDRIVVALPRGQSVAARPLSAGFLVEGVIPARDGVRLIARRA